MTSPVTHYVRADQYGAHLSRAIHDGWDEKEANEHTAALAKLSHHPAKPLARTREKPDRGSRDNPKLVAQAAANRRGGPTLLAPVTSTASWMASALAPAIDIGASGISAMASSLSSAMAKGVNPTKDAAFEKAKEFIDAAYSVAAPVSREASRNFQNFARCHLRSLPVAAT